MTATLRRKRKQDLAEDTAFGKGPRLNKEKGIVTGVKILGFSSKHGYRYSQRALEEAVPMYENIAVNVNHPPRDKLNSSRRYEDRFGRMKNVSFQEGRGIVGDLHYNKKHPLVEQFEYDVENEPLNVGLSQNASGSTVRRGGELVVESIDLLRSVDLVADPATNKGLFESKGDVRMRVRRKKVRRGRSNLQRTAARLLEAADERRRKEKPKSTKKAMMDMIESVLDNNKDPRAIRSKVNSILGLADGEANGGNSSPHGKPNMKSKKKQLAESVLVKKVARLERRDRVRDLCEDVGFRPTKTQLKAIVKMDTKKEAKELIESMRSKPQRKGAKASEGREGKRKKESSTREFLESIGLEIDDPNDKD